MCHSYTRTCFRFYSLHWRHNEPDGVSNHQPRDCLLNCLFRFRSKKTPKLRVTGLCAENSPGTCEFSAEMASYAENVFIWWRHHVTAVAPFWLTWANFNHGWIITYPVKCGMKLVIHSQTSTAAPFGEWVSNLIIHFIMDEIVYPCRDLN